jgi:hypothetical protein
MPAKMAIIDAAPTLDALAILKGPMIAARASL